MRTSFYLYFPERPAAEEAGKRLRGEGYDVVVREGADEVSWLALATIGLREDGLDAVEELMDALADELGGEYDGYERATRHAPPQEAPRPASTGSKVSYAEGDVVAVPLEDGGFALGVVARKARGGILLGYFFGPRREAVPAAGALPELRPADAVEIHQFGDRGIIEGTWPVIGPLPRWRRADWPMPAFRSPDPVSDAVMKVVYDDDDPSRELRRERIDPREAERLPQDGLAGAEFMERRLSRLLTASSDG